MSPAAELFASVAAGLLTARQALRDAIGNAEPAAALAAVALVEQAGALADDAAERLGAARCASADAWLRSPRDAEALRALDATPEGKA